MRRSAQLALALVLLLGVPWGSPAAPLAAAAEARPPAGEVFAQGCVQGYAKAFLDLSDRATALQLKAESAAADMKGIFKARPVRCEAGGYDYFLTVFMRFAKRALRSGATPTTPKEGWVRAAAAACDYAPRLVPQAEYTEDMGRFHTARAELAGLVTEAGAGPAASALLVAFDRAAPAPGAYGPPAAPVVTSSTARVPAPVVTGSTGPLPGPGPAPASAQAMTPQQVNVPSVPLPDWGVVNLYQMSELIQQGRDAAATRRLEQILRWIESQR